MTVILLLINIIIISQTCQTGMLQLKPFVFLVVILTEEILSAKCRRRKDERIWRDSKLTVLLEIYRNSCLIKISRYDSSCQRKPFFKYISNYNGQSKEISQLVNSLLGRNKQTVYIQYDCDSTLVSSFNSFLLITFLIYVQVELPL